MGFWLAQALTPPVLEPLELPLARVRELSWLDALLSYPPFKALLPVPILIGLAPIVIWFFGKWWREINHEVAEERTAEQARAERAARATPGRALSRRRRSSRSPASQLPSSRPRWLRTRSARTASSGLPSSGLPSSGSPSSGLARSALRSSGSTEPALAAPGLSSTQAVQVLQPVRWGFLARKLALPRRWLAPRAAARTLARFDLRPAACMAIVAVVLTMQEYYGGRETFDHWVRPWLAELEAHGYKFIAFAKYEDLWSHFWWVVCRVVGYVVVPFGAWAILFPRDQWRDMGLRVTGLRQHLWIYGLCLGVVIPSMFIVASQPDFGTYYPFYKQSSRSVWDFALWEAMYFAQFLALEMFFRGWILGALRRSMGAAAIFAMVVPYCMIHYGKPYLEANGAIVAGIVLGTLAMRTRSVYLGFLVHITVAFSMDFLALYKRAALPTVLWPPG